VTAPAPGSVPRPGSAALPGDASLYDLPRYYDIAFAPNTEREIAVLQRIFDDFSIAAPARLLEPACGSGRLAVPLARAGYRVAGYDLNHRMLAHGRSVIEQHGLTDSVALAHADMAAAAFDETFDAAFCLIGSLGHLHDDPRIIQHLRRTGDALVADGIYVVQLTCLYEADSVHEQLDWSAERDGIRVHAFWEIEHEDVRRGLARQHCRLSVTLPGGATAVHDDRFDLRLWTFDDWRMLIDASGAFDLAAIYDETGEPLDWDDQCPVTGEDGNLLYVLQRSPVRPA